MADPQSGRFITLEGGEGAGKTTQAQRLAARLGQCGVDTLVTREPGGTPMAEAVRGLLLSRPDWRRLADSLLLELEAGPDAFDGGEEEASLATLRALLGGAGAPVAPSAEALLHFAARADHWERAIQPMLAKGRWVICDRFSDSTMAYQGVAGGLGKKRVRAMAKAAAPDAAPHKTIVLDLDPEVGLARARGRAADPDRYEARDLDFHAAVRGAFLAIADDEPERCVVIDAAGEPDAVAAAVWSAVEPLLGDAQA